MIAYDPFYLWAKMDLKREYTVLGTEKNIKLFPRRHTL